ncbi:MAG: DUF423 domain-containing protein [Flavobacteriaceae bacterium]|nr:DUF423 domain-containing protein [Flavobacteriaceae bacterium]
MNKTVLIIATIYGALAIILGAFGAHGLKKIYSPELLSSFETGVKYQMYHAIFLLVLGLGLKLDSALLKYASFSVILGVILFSFSIYIITWFSSNGVKLGLINLITPIGGLLLISGWVLTMVHFIRD